MTEGLPLESFSKLSHVATFLDGAPGITWRPCKVLALLGASIRWYGLVPCGFSSRLPFIMTEGLATC